MVASVPSSFRMPLFDRKKEAPIRTRRATFDAHRPSSTRNRCYGWNDHVESLGDGIRMADQPLGAPRDLEPPWRSAIVRRTLAGCLVVLCVAIVTTYWDFTKPPYLAANDFSPDYAAAKEWRAGGDPYAPLATLHRKYFDDDTFAAQYVGGQGNPHPPTAIVLTAPLTGFGFRTARIIHLALMLGAVGLALALFCRRLGLTTLTTAVVVFGGLALPVTEYDVRWAGASGLILLALVWGWSDLRKARDARAGAILGVATALKVFPVMMVIPLIRMRRWKAVGWMVGTTALVSAGAALAIGIGSSWEFATEAVRDNYRNWSAAPHSVSLVSLPFRLFASDRWFDPNANAPGFVPLLSGLALAVCVIGAIKTSGRLSGDRFWATVPWMILASPIAWPHYLVMMIPLLVLISIRTKLWGPLKRIPLVVAFTVLGLGVTFVIWSSDVLGFSLGYRNQVAAMTVLLIALLGVGLADFKLRARGG
jgi:hypothetical protein